MTRQFTIDLNDTEAATVESLAAEAGTSPAVVLRYLIRSTSFPKVVALQHGTYDYGDVYCSRVTKGHEYRASRVRPIMVEHIKIEQLIESKTG